MTEFTPEEFEGGLENPAIEELGQAFFTAGNSELFEGGGAEIDEDDPIEPIDI